MTRPIEVSKDELFKKTVDELVAKYDLQDVVETGTHRGTGSTRVFADTGLNVYTIECNPYYVEEARRNLAKYRNVTVFHGLSVPFEAAVKAIVTDSLYDGPVPEGIKTDTDCHHRNFYLAEIASNHTARDNLLNLFISDRRRQLIFLDSAGGLGRCELTLALESISRVSGLKVLMLDDIDHVKHFRSVEALNKDAQHFASLGRFGYVVIGE